MLAYLNEATKKDDNKFLLTALGDVVRARNLHLLSRKTGMSREKIDNALSKDGNPTFATMLKIINALG